MTKKNQSEIKLGAIVRLRVHSGEIVEGRVVHMWEEKSLPMVRVASGDLVYNVPARMLMMKRDRNDRDRRKGLDLRGRYAVAAPFRYSVGESTAETGSR
jgi:hypothetical protein